MKELLFLTGFNRGSGRKIYELRSLGLIDLDGIPGKIETSNDPDHPVKFVPVVEVQEKVALAS